jgi:flagellar basal body-associated protein FliL
MQPVGQDAERTQVVPGSPAAGDRTQAIQGRPGDRTQVVQGFGQNQGGYNAQYYTTEGPGWQGQESSPWSGSEFPPLGPAGNWGVKQGPEVFETGGGGKGRRVFLIVAIVVVLALVGGGIYFFTSQHGSNQATGGGHPTTTTTAPPKPKPKPVHPDEPLLDQVPPVVGTLNQRGLLVNVSDLVQKQIADQAATTLFTQAGVQQVAWRDGSKAADQFGPTPDYFSVTVIPLNSADAATSLAQQLRRYQESNGLTYVHPPVQGVPSTIVFEKHTAPSVTIYRGLWVCGNYVIWVNVVQQPTTNEQALTTSFQREIVSLTQAFPAE